MGDGIASAFDRLEDFLAIQGAMPSMEAVLNLQAAVGIDDDERMLIRERVDALGCGEDAGAVLLGVLVGLFAARLRLTLSQSTQPATAHPAASAAHSPGTGARRGSRAPARGADDRRGRVPTVAPDRRPDAAHEPTADEIPDPHGSVARLEGGKPRGMFSFPIVFSAQPAAVEVALPRIARHRAGAHAPA